MQITLKALADHGAMSKTGEGERIQAEGSFIFQWVNEAGVWVVLIKRLRVSYDDYY